MPSLRTALALLLFPVLAGCEATLARGLDEDEANRVVVALDHESIGATKRPQEGQDGKYEVRVASDDVASALSVLRSSGLPREPERGLAEMFPGDSLVPTATEEHARYVVGLAGDLARSIEAIDGVVDARVHLALPEPSPIALDDGTPRPHPTASVLVRHHGRVLPADPNGIRTLVAGAVEGMRPEDVSVLSVPVVASRHAREGGLVTVGPIAVTRGSSTALKAVFGVTIAGNLVLAAILVLVLLRRRRVAEPT